MSFLIPRDLCINSICVKYEVKLLLNSGWRKSMKSMKTRNRSKKNQLIIYYLLIEEEFINNVIINNAVNIFVHLKCWEMHRWFQLLSGCFCWRNGHWGEKCILSEYIWVRITPLMHKFNILQSVAMVDIPLNVLQFTGCKIKLNIAEFSFHVCGINPITRVENKSTIYRGTHRRLFQRELAVIFPESKLFQ